MLAVILKPYISCVYFRFFVLLWTPYYGMLQWWHSVNLKAILLGRASTIHLSSIREIKGLTVLRIAQWDLRTRRADATEEIRTCDRSIASQAWFQCFLVFPWTRILIFIALYRLVPRADSRVNYELQPSVTIKLK